MKALIDINSYLYDDIWELLLDMRSHVMISREQYITKHYPKKLYIGWECNSHWYGISLIKFKNTVGNKDGALIDMTKNVEGIAYLINNLQSSDPGIKELDRLVKLREFA